MAEQGEAAVFPGRHDRLRHQLLDAARALLLFGAVTAVSGAATQAFLGLMLWLLGVCLVALVPVAGRINQGAIPKLLFNSARLLVLWGASAVAGNTTPTNATVGLLLWVLGVWLLALVPAAERRSRNP